MTRYLLVLLSLLGAGCSARERVVAGHRGAVVVAAVGEPPSVLPPLAFESVARDVGDLVWQRLATLPAGAASIDSAAYRPELAWRWERLDLLTWRFHLRPDARWQDGQPVTAEDVVFSFHAYADSIVDALARTAVSPIRVDAEDSLTVLIRFPRPSPEQLYDATYHVRILPAHIWSGIPADRWQGDTAVAHLVGSGPYRVSAWRRGNDLTLVADSALPAKQRPGIARVIFRFTRDPNAALNLVLSHEADLLETLIAPDAAARVAADSAYRVVTYPSAVYGFLAFNLRNRRSPLADSAVRRALAMAVDRDAVAKNAFGPEAHAPAGPMSALAWIGEKGIETAPFDTTAARQALTPRLASRIPRPVSFDILVPSTSPSRRRMAEALQEAWRRVGATVTVTAVDFPVFQERLAAGKFDSYIGAYLDEPTLRGLEDQWGTVGFNAQNYGHFSDRRFDSLLALAGQASDTAVAGARYRGAISLLNADAPAIFLYTPVNAAAVRRDIGNVTINPYSWLATLPSWR